MTDYLVIARFPHYLVGSDGTIYRKGRARPMMQRLKANGYFDVPLCEGGKYYVNYVHRLVCEAFHGAPPFKFECRHKNGVKTDNRADNLAWGTKAQNEEDKNDHGTRLRGERSYQSKLTEDGVLYAREMARDGMRESDIADSFGAARITIHDAITGKNWKHLPGPVRRGRWPSLSAKTVRDAGNA